VLECIARGQQELRDEISTWQRELSIGLNVPRLKKKLDVVEQVQKGGGIHTKKPGQLAGLFLCP
jgi:hypothetical protein